MPQRILRMNYDVPAAAADAAGVKTSAITTYGASAGSIVATVAGWNWTALVTCAVAVVGLVAQLYFMVRRDRREAAESAVRIAALRGKCEL